MSGTRPLRPTRHGPGKPAGTRVIESARTFGPDAVVLPVTHAVGAVHTVRDLVDVRDAARA